MWLLDLLLKILFIIFLYLLFVYLSMEMKKNRKYSYYQQSHAKLTNDSANSKYHSPDEYFKYRTLLQIHREKYFCHICNKGSTPLKIFNITFWNHYTGLKKCRKCKKLTCQKHIHSRICENCSNSTKKS